MKHRNKLLRAFHCPPQCHDWDDFFDFSRWSLPNHSRNIPSRAWSNMTSSFTGNYVWCWLDVMFIIGLINKKILMAQAVIVCLWCAICLATEQTVPTERKITRSSVRAFSLNQRVSRLKDINEYLLLYLILSLTFVCTQHVLFLRFEVIGSCNAWKLCVIFYDGPYRILRCNIIDIHIYLYPCRWATCDR